MKTKAIITLALLLISVGTGMGGYWIGLYQGHTREALSQQVVQQQALIAQQQTLQEQYQHRVDLADQQVTQLRTEKATIEQQAHTLRERIAYVTHHYKPAPTAPAEVLPRCIFTRGFVRLWDNANGATPVPTVTPATGANGESTAAGAADTPSHVTRADLLENVVANGSRCQRIAAQLNALIDYLNRTRTP